MTHLLRILAFLETIFFLGGGGRPSRLEIRKLLVILDERFDSIVGIITSTRWTYKFNEILINIQSVWKKLCIFYSSLNWMCYPTNFFGLRTSTHELSHPVILSLCRNVPTTNVMSNAKWNATDHHLIMFGYILAETMSSRGLLNTDHDSGVVSSLVNYYRHVSFTGTTLFDNGRRRVWCRLVIQFKGRGGEHKFFL